MSIAYGAVAAHRLRHAPRARVPIPVLCVGNPTVGGSGKTPTALALAEAARSLGLVPGFLSRGHGSNIRETRLLRAADRAADVGDEPLLLARAGPVAVGRDRAAGARLLAEAGCRIAIMDDGFQSAQVAIGCALLVVDRAAGLGNALPLPAGPLRAPIDVQLDYADAVLAMGEGEAAGPFLAMAEARGLPIFSARLSPRNPEALRGRRVLAFAGIGRPEKFFRSLEEAGAEVVRQRSFGDHHPYTREELANLHETAAREGLLLATTEKDRARIGSDTPKGWDALVLEVETRFAEEDAPKRLIAMALEGHRALG